MAEFCPVCRKIQSFQIHSVHAASHLYGVTTGMKLLGHSGTCDVCNTPIEVNPTDYRDFTKQGGEPVGMLIQQTFPRIHQQREARLAVEERLRRGALLPGERETLLMEPFRIFSDVTETTFGGETQIRGRGGWGLLGTVLSCIGIAWAGRYFNVDRDLMIGVVTIVAVVGVVYSLIQLILEPGRIFSRQVYPNLVNALRPLKPSQKELADVLMRFKKSGFRIGKKVKADKLMRAIAERPAPVGLPRL